MAMRLPLAAATRWLRDSALVASVAILMSVAFAPSPALAQSSCATGACVSVGPRLASVDSSRGALLNLLTQALLGSSVNVSVLDWDALAQSDINLNLLLLQLQNDLGVSSTQEVLDTELTLSQLRLAMLQVAQADGNTALVNALDALQVPLGPLVGTLQLGDLLAIDFPQGALADIHLDVLDLLVGSVQLYNFKNVATTGTDPVVVDTAALGLPGLARLSLRAQVVEPPTQVCGPTSSQFHTAAIRIKLDLQLADGLDVQPLLDALAALTLGLSNVQLSAELLELEVYADVARAEGSIALLDLLSNVVTLQARPGLVGLYIGEIPDAVFFNRNTTITNAVVAPIRATNLVLDFNIGLNLTLPVLGELLNVNTTVKVPLGVDLRAAATGAPDMRTVTATGPFPRLVEVPCGSHCAGDLVTDLLQNLDVDIAPGTITAMATVPVLGTISVDLPTAILDAIVSTLEGALRNLLVPLLEPLLGLLLGNLVDPVLGLVGVHIGEMVVHAEGLFAHCPTTLRLLLAVVPPTNPGRFDLSIALAGNVLAAQADAGSGDVIEVVDALHGESYDLAGIAAAGTDADMFVPTWRCADQDDVEHGSGSGDTFSLVVPEGTTSALTVTCTLNQRQLEADLSLTKDNGTDGVVAGSTGTYVIRVTNAGPDPVTGATLNDPLTAGLTLSAPWQCEATPGSSCHATSGGAAGDSGMVVVLLDLAVGGEATITVPVQYSANLADYD